MAAKAPSSSCEMTQATGRMAGRSSGRARWKFRKNSSTRTAPSAIARPNRCDRRYPMSKYLCLGCMLLIVAGCTRSSAGKPSADTGVAVGTPQKKTLKRVIEQPAFIEAYEETPLIARVPGYVEKVPAD